MVNIHKVHSLNTLHFSKYYLTLAHQLEMNSNFFILIALSQHSSSNEKWYLAWFYVIHQEIWGIQKEWVTCPNGPKINWFME